MILFEVSILYQKTFIRTRFYLYATFATLGYGIDLVVKSPTTVPYFVGVVHLISSAVLGFEVFTIHY
jgi:hypothetical protein